MEDTTLWKIITGAIGTLVGYIWIDNKADVKETKKKLDSLAASTYTKEETNNMIKLHTEPLSATQAKMWDDIKEIKSILMQGKRDA